MPHQHQPEVKQIYYINLIELQENGIQYYSQLNLEDVYPVHTPSLIDTVKNMSTKPLAKVNSYSFL